MPETDSDSVINSRYWVGDLHPIFTVNPVPLLSTRIIRLLHATQNDVRFRENPKRKPADNCEAIASGFSSQVSPTLFRVFCCRLTTAEQIVGLACSVVKSHRQKEKSTLPAEGSHQEGEQGEAPARTIVLNCLVKSNRKFFRETFGIWFESC